MHNRMKHIRTTLKLTQSDFASRIGIARGALAKIEAGNNQPSAQTLHTVCTTFGVSRDWILNGIGEMFCTDPALPQLTALPPDDIRVRVVTALSRLTESERTALSAILDKIKE